MRLTDEQVKKLEQEFDIYWACNEEEPGWNPDIDFDNFHDWAEIKGYNKCIDQLEIIKSKLRNG